MKKLAALLLLVMTGTSFAVDPVTVNRSSYTQTNESAYIAASYLDNVIISSAGIATGNLKIYNSTFTTNTLIANISLGSLFYYDFKNLQVKGIYYVTTNNSNAGVTIEYKK